MPIPDIFRGSAYSMTTLTASINNMPYLPQGLGNLGLYQADGIATTTAEIEQQDGELIVLPTKPRGAPGTPITGDRRNARPVKVPSIPATATVYADECQNVRAFGTEAQLETPRQKVDERLAKGKGSMELTWELHRLGGIRGQILDADGSVIYDCYELFGVERPAPIAFNLGKSNRTVSIAQNCANVIRTTRRNAKVGNMPKLKIRCLCADDAFDALINDAECKKAYDRFQESVVLRTDYTWAEFYYKGIWFENYQGTDDNATVAIASGQMHFFPENVPGMFIVRFAPANTWEAVNTKGLPFYAWIDETKSDAKQITIEMQSNPLFLCVRPRALQTGEA